MFQSFYSNSKELASVLGNNLDHPYGYATLVGVSQILSTGGITFNGQFSPSTTQGKKLIDMGEYIITYSNVSYNSKMDIIELFPYKITTLDLISQIGSMVLYDYTITNEKIYIIGYISSSKKNQVIYCSINDPYTWEFNQYLGLVNEQSISVMFIDGLYYALTISTVAPIVNKIYSITNLFDPLSSVTMLVAFDNVKHIVNTGFTQIGYDFYTTTSKSTATEKVVNVYPKNNGNFIVNNLEVVNMLTKTYQHYDLTITYPTLLEIYDHIISKPSGFSNNIGIPAFDIITDGNKNNSYYAAVGSGKNGTSYGGTNYKYHYPLLFSMFSEGNIITNLTLTNDNILKKYCQGDSGTDYDFFTYYHTSNYSDLFTDCIVTDKYIIFNYYQYIYPNTVGNHRISQKIQINSYNLSGIDNNYDPVMTPNISWGDVFDNTISYPISMKRPTAFNVIKSQNNKLYAFFSCPLVEDRFGISSSNTLAIYDATMFLPLYSVPFVKNKNCYIRARS